MSNTNIPVEPGKEYEVRHIRKGRFFMKIKSISGEWIIGTVTMGIASATMWYNTKYPGDEITIRDEQSFFIPINNL